MYITTVFSLSLIKSDVNNMLCSMNVIKIECFDQRLDTADLKHFRFS